ncbi:MAG: antibiotic biosynthesis monooxygenase [Burkholderiaceae bacterium]|jgi:heme-degrading monooxygenase HmoA|nr:antibiotic biosynthesis monooxygenase [Burkholderiaceae bacterium]
MILELVDLFVHDGTQTEFDKALEQGLHNVLRHAKGFRGYRINKGIEQNTRYVLMNYWETLENHTVDFRGSPAFPQWRAYITPYLAKPPVVEHFHVAGELAQ